MSYAETLRRELERHRFNGRPFDLAWGYAVCDFPAPDDDWADCLSSMRGFFEVAYTGAPLERGACLVPTDTSAMTRGVWAKGGSVSVEPVCRSGSGCGEVATEHGMDGLKWWCERHGAQLAALRLTPDETTPDDVEEYTYA